MLFKPRLVLSLIKMFIAGETCLVSIADSVCDVGKIVVAIARVVKMRSQADISTLIEVASATLLLVQVHGKHQLSDVMLTALHEQRSLYVLLEDVHATLVAQ